VFITKVLKIISRHSLLQSQPQLCYATAQYLGNSLLHLFFGRAGLLLQLLGKDFNSHDA